VKTLSVIFAITLIFYGSVKAQEIVTEEPIVEQIRKNSVYLEIMGNGAVYSLNYDRIIPLQKKIALFIRIGGNEYHGSFTDTLSLNFIASAGILHGGPNHFVEPSVGFTYFSGAPDRLVVLACGYRFQGRKGFTFRGTPMFIINSEKGDTFGNSLWFGASFGYSF